MNSPIVREEGGRERERGMEASLTCLPPLSFFPPFDAAPQLPWTPPSPHPRCPGSVCIFTSPPRLQAPQEWGQDPQHLLRAQLR